MNFFAPLRLCAKMFFLCVLCALCGQFCMYWQLKNLTGMKMLHGSLDVTGNELRHDIERIINRTVYRCPIITGRILQHVGNHVIPMSRVTDADAQAQEIIAAEMRDQVAQAVVPAVAATFLELDGSDRQIQVIVDDEDGAARYPVKTGQRGHRRATAIHEVHWLLQAAFHAIKRAARDIALVFTIGSELRVAAAGKLVYKPEPGVMPGLFVLCSGITQPGDELNGSHAG
jgi:hypothetical protein